jgi:hypothetical protein
MRMPLVLVSLLAFAALPAPAPAAEAANGRALFQRLGTLAGTWSGTTSSGKTHHVSFRTTASGSVLVETWTLGAGRESMTLYALDGDRLLATHYCPQGNQPRLVYTGTDAQGRAQFRFVDGTNLHVPGSSHQQAFWIRFDGEREFSRGETYIENDTAADTLDDGEAVHYARSAE